MQMSSIHSREMITALKSDLDLLKVKYQQGDKTLEQVHQYDVIIIGSGWAGLSSGESDTC